MDISLLETHITKVANEAVNAKALSLANMFTGLECVITCMAAALHNEGILPGTKMIDLLQRQYEELATHPDKHDAARTVRHVQSLLEISLHLKTAPLTN